MNRSVRAAAVFLCAITMVPIVPPASADAGISRPRVHPPAHTILKLPAGHVTLPRIPARVAAPNVKTLAIVRSGASRAVNTAWKAPSVGAAPRAPRSILDRSFAAARRTLTVPAVRQPAVGSPAHKPSEPRRVTGGSRSPLLVSPAPDPAATPHCAGSMCVQANASTTTGIKPWWTYFTADIPGIGSMGTNVANRNLVIETVDIDIPNPGVPLRMGRTFNSQSHHDASGSDGSTPSQLGNGWTSSFDMHIAVNSSNGLSVFDDSGARYDYVRITDTASTGHWTPPPGVHATLTTVDNGGTYYWTQKNGTTYAFYGPTPGDVTQTGYAGRLYRIIGRNNNTYLNFTYQWSSNASSVNNLQEIDITAQGGRRIREVFAPFAGHQLLSQLIYPDGATTVQYQYDAAGNLLSVTKPRTNTSSAPPQEVYAYGSGTFTVESPRYASSLVNGFAPGEPQGGLAGGYEVFQLDAGGGLTGIQWNGVINLVPADGTNTALQDARSVPGGIPAGQSTTYLFTQVGVNAAGNLQVTDSDSHQVTYVVDSAGRVLATYDNPGPSTGFQLEKTYTWDDDNNRISESDETGQLSNFEYDAFGNLVAVASPRVGNLASVRPTTLFSYDQNDNEVASCAPSFTHSKGLDWANSPPPATNPCPAVTGGSNPDGTCALVAGATIATWPTTPAEPFGRLQSSTNPCGYVTTYNYAAASQSGLDQGLLTLQQGAIMTNVDGSNRQPTYSAGYDADGNIVSYSDGVGTWTMTYDSGRLGRIVAITDPDTLVYRRTYNPDGSVAATFAPAQFANGTGASFTYDLDGNETASVRHFGGAAGTYRRWFDAADRMVEMVMPTPSPPGTGSTNDGGRCAGCGAANYRLPQNDGGFPAWMQRYEYDLNGVAHPGGKPVDANHVQYGELYQVQEYTYNLSTRTFSWINIKGLDSDGVGRTLARYEQGITGNTVTPVAQFYYDYEGQVGHLSQTSKPQIGSRSFSYDELGRETYAATTSSTGTLQPSERTDFDLDGNVTALTQDTFGTFSYGWDAAGRLVSKTEPSTPYNDMPSMFTLTYYADGLRNSLSIAPAPGSAGLAAPNLLQYSYRPNGQLQKKRINSQPFSSGASAAFSGGCFGYTYTNAGRLKSRSDPYTVGCNAGTRSIPKGPRMPLNTYRIASPGPPTIASPLPTPTPASFATSSPLSDGSVSVAPPPDTTNTGGGREPQGVNQSPAPVPMGDLRYSYDQYGRVSAETLPSGGVYDTFAYDPEGEVTDFNGYSVPTDTAHFPGRHVVNAYTIRGELSQQHYYLPPASGSGNDFDLDWPHLNNRYINSMPVTPGLDVAFDIHNGFKYGFNLPSSEVTAVQQFAPYQSCASTIVNQMGWNRDSLGRDVSGVSSIITQTDPNTCQAQNQSYYNGTATRGYDFDNHLVNFNTPPNYNGLAGVPDYWPAPAFAPTCGSGSPFLYIPGLNVNYSWGADGHPLAVVYAQNGGTRPFTVHWFDDTPFMTTTNGSIDGLHVDTDGDINFQGTLIVRDRDWEGNLVQSHDAWGFSQWQPPSPYQNHCVQPNSPPKATGYDNPQDPFFTMPSPNGFFDGFHVIAGERTYDPQMARFSAPDSEFGTVGDPYSFKSYAWDRGNPNIFADPSGHQSEEMPQCCGDGFLYVSPSRPVVNFTVGVYNEFLGNDISIVLNGHEATWRRTLAGAVILGNFVPGVDEVEWGVRGLRVLGGSVRFFGREHILYDKISAIGQHLKYGVTVDRFARYSRVKLEGGSLVVLARGTREEMLRLERDLHRHLPIGPEERQSFYREIQRRLGYVLPPAYRYNPHP